MVWCGSSMAGFGGIPTATVIIESWWPDAVDAVAFLAESALLRP